MGYRIIKKFWFDAGHRMYNHDILADRGAKLVNQTSSDLGWQRFKCANPHGHTFHVELFFESDSLDAQCVVIDTDKIKRVIKEFMDKYDHAYILGKDDPLKEGLLKLFEGYRIVIMDAVPTAEAIAEEIYRFFDKRLRTILSDEYPSTFRLVEVRLQMATTLVAIYRP
ncbi:MAG: 6-carboxytetrahydropterin synthase [candidate division WOR-3 bacterium]